MTLVFLCTVSVWATSAEDWAERWDDAVSDYAVISMTPGADDSQMRFAWLEKIGQPAAFRCGIDEALSDADAVPVCSVLTVTGQKRCSVTVTGLRENTVYYYMYKRNGSWSGVYSFRTGGAELTALFVSDSQLGRSGDWRKKDVLLHDTTGWDTTLREAVRQYPDISLCLSAGDQAEIGASERQYRLLLAPDVLRGIPIATTIGNHEFYFPLLDLHFAQPNRFGGSVIHSLGDEPYYFVKQDVLFIVLDSNDPLAWDHEAVIEKAVRACPDARWRVVMMHHSLYSCENSEEKGPRLRTSLTPILQKYGINLVLSGHTHRFSRSKSIDGITYLEGGCCSGCNCRACPDVLPSYTDYAYPQKNPVYSVLHFGKDAITTESYAVENGESVRIDAGSVALRVREDPTPQMSVFTKTVQSVLSVFGRIVSMLFV